MFKRWLETENASWNQLLEALRSQSVQLMYLANQIEQKFVGKCMCKQHASIDIVQPKEWFAAKLEWLLIFWLFYCHIVGGSIILKMRFKIWVIC